jgi:hypothetical protein
MPSNPSNYPPGVSGNEFEIIGWPEHTLESHEKEMPNCSDPDCEFHHPEVLEPVVVVGYNDGEGNYVGEQLFLVCRGCGETFDSLSIAMQHGVQETIDSEEEFEGFDIKFESEAL